MKLPKLDLNLAILALLLITLAITYRTAKNAGRLEVEIENMQEHLVELKVIVHQQDSIKREKDSLTQLAKDSASQARQKVIAVERKNVPIIDSLVNELLRSMADDTAKMQIITLVEKYEERITVRDIEIKRLSIVIAAQDSARAARDRLIATKDSIILQSQELVNALAKKASPSLVKRILNAIPVALAVILINKATQ